MGVTRVNYRDRSGQLRTASKWYVQFRDQNGRRRRLPAFSNKAASMELARKIEQLVDYFRASGGAIDPTLQSWIAELPRDTADSLVRIGVIDARRAATGKNLHEHLAEFRDALRAKGVTQKHITLLSTRITRLLDECGFRSWSDLHSSAVMAKLNDMAAESVDEDGRETPGISAQTFNFYLQAIKQFCRWAVKDRRIAESPVAHLQGLNVRTDRRHDRRALTMDELRELLKHVATATTRFGISGSDRAILYRVAVETGLRVGELRSLTRASMRLRGEAPSITVSASYSKRRRQDTLPLRPDTAAFLRKHLRGKPDGELVFQLPDKPAKMFRADLEAARSAWIEAGKTEAEKKSRAKSAFLRYADKSGRVADFHALRHTFISNLARGGVHPKLAQDLARHSDVNLTLSRYSHTELEEQANALASLPSLDAASCSDEGSGIGASCAGEPDEPVLHQCLRTFEQLQSTSVDSSGLNTGQFDRAQLLAVLEDVLDLAGLTQQPPSGLEPLTCGLQNRCSAN